MTDLRPVTDFDLAALLDELTGGRPVLDPEAVVRELLRRIPPQRHAVALAQALRTLLDQHLVATPPAARPQPPEDTPTATEEPATRPITTPPRPRDDRPAPPPRPATSPKVAAIRAAWRDELAAGVTVGDRTKRLADCTRFDLKVGADDHDIRARRYRRLAELLDEHDVEHVYDLPSDVLAAALTEEPQT